MNYIIDTNILIEIENNNKDVIERLLRIPRDAQFFITFFTFCEYYNGIINRSEENKQKLLDRISKYYLLNTTRKTGITFCEMHHELQKTGNNIPQFDIFIASLAVEHNMTIITADQHFKKVNKLKKIILDI